MWFKKPQVASFRNTFEKEFCTGKVPANMVRGNTPAFQIWHVYRNDRDLFHCKFTGSYSKVCPGTESSCSNSRSHRSFVLSLRSLLQNEMWGWRWQPWSLKWQQKLWEIWWFDELRWSFVFENYGRCMWCKWHMTMIFHRHSVDKYWTNQPSSHDSR